MTEETKKMLISYYGNKCEAGPANAKAIFETLTLLLDKIPDKTLEAMLAEVNAIRLQKLTEEKSFIETQLAEKETLINSIK